MSAGFVLSTELVTIHPSNLQKPLATPEEWRARARRAETTVA